MGSTEQGTPPSKLHSESRLCRRSPFGYLACQNKEQRNYTQLHAYLGIYFHLKRSPQGVGKWRLTSLRSNAWLQMPVSGHFLYKLKWIASCIHNCIVVACLYFPKGAV